MTIRPSFNPLLATELFAHVKECAACRPIAARIDAFVISTLGRARVDADYDMLHSLTRSLCSVGRTLNDLTVFDAYARGEQPSPR